MLQKTTE